MVSIFLIAKLFAQSPIDIGSISADSLNKIANEIRKQDPDSAFGIAQEALELSKLTKNSLQEAMAYKILGIIAIQSRNYEEAEIYLNNGINLIDSVNDGNNLANFYKILGILYAEQTDYPKAIKSMLSALNIYEKSNDFYGIVSCNDNLGILYKRLGKFEKSILHQKVAIQIIEMHDVEYDISNILHNMGVSYSEIGKIDSAIILLKKALYLSKKRDDQYAILITTGTIAATFATNNQLDSADIYYNSEMELALRLNNKSSMAINMINQGANAFRKNELIKAIDYVEEGMAILEEIGELREQYFGYQILRDIYIKQGDFTNAYFAFEKSVQINDSIFGIETQNKVTELEAKYESEKKEKKIELLNRENQINKLEIEKKRTNLWVSLVVASLVVLSLVFVILYSRKKQKVKQMMVLQKSQNKLLEMERKVLTTIIDTEDKERKRFAEDIHDGVGPLLSSIKLYLGEISSSEKEEQKQMIDYAKELTSEAIGNIRDISHNIMPGSLSENGLMESVHEFCEKIKFTKQLNINIENKIGNKRFGHSIELIIYRIIIELINNTLKHAKATAVNISFVKGDNLLEINYSDNGVGFDVEKLNDTGKKGIGLLNIKRRVASIDGKCDIKSEKGKGIEVKIKLAI